MTGHAGHRPLVVFTCLAVAGSGLVSASAYFELVHGLAAPAAVAAGAVLLAAGLAVSLGHLGQKQKAPLVVRGAGRSSLSNEALLAGLAVTAAAVAAGLGLRGAPSTFATAAAGVTNAACLVSVGLVYRVRGQRTWQGFSALTPLTGGLAFGAIAMQSLAEPDGVFAATLLVIAIDALVFSQRWRDIAAVAFGHRGRGRHQRRVPRLDRPRVSCPRATDMAGILRLDAAHRRPGLRRDRHPVSGGA